MMIGIVEINVLIEGGLDIPFTEGWLRGVAERTLVAEKVGAAAELGLVITSDDQVHRLNRLFRGIDEPTDVLSFATMETKAGAFPGFIPPPDGLQHLGEVIIAYPQAVRQAAENGHSVEQEVALLVVHGVLHLLGYEHDAPECEAAMRAREAAILDGIEGLCRE